MTRTDQPRISLRFIRATRYFSNKAALPGHTLLQISRLASPAYQLEVEVIAILPARG